MVIDEASQCDIASAIPLFYRAKKVVIIGDPKQLKHISILKELVDKRTALFFARGKEILNKINENLIKQIREEIDKIIKEMD